jgi:hypothetical protein
LIRIAASKAVATLLARGGRALEKARPPVRLTAEVRSRVERDARLVCIGLFIAISVAYLLVVEFRVHWLGSYELFSDAYLYYDATAAWISGGNPWTTTYYGTTFAGPPTTLILNLPLQLLGREIAPAFWAIAGMASWLFTIRRLRLAPYWFLFPPFWEAYLPGSPDPTLFALIVLGGGPLAALTKPYSVPGMLADGRWRAVFAAAGVGLATLPLLPWSQFIDNVPAVQETFDTLSRHTSAWGDPPLMIAAGIALLSLGPRRALGMAVPVLWPGGQFHYSIFSIGTGAAFIGLGVVLTFPHVAAPGVIAYAVIFHAWRLVRITLGDPDCMPAS